MTADIRRPEYLSNELTLLSPAVELETKAVLKQCIGARAAIAESRKLFGALSDSARIHAPTSETVIHPVVGHFKTPKFMITGEIKSQVDAIWNAFWTGFVSNWHVQACAVWCGDP